MGTSQAAPRQQLSPQQLNSIARSLIQQSSIQMIQQVYSTTVVPANVGNVINVVPRNVGLIKGFWVQVTATIANPSGAAITPTDFGPANVLSQIVFTDLNNNVRIQCAGWYLNQINSLKARTPYGQAFKNSAYDSPIN